MGIVTVNRGSSSLKLRVVEEDGTVSASADPASLEGLGPFISAQGDLEAAAHRIVHGGPDFLLPTLLDPGDEDRLRQLADLAPLHNSPGLEALDLLRRLRPELPQVACFDTTFHASLPPEAATYALPASWRTRFPLRRFGFHGLSHAWCAEAVARLLGQGDLRLVSAHIGSGASVTAVVAGRSLDTTMGFTPLEGLVMGTRSGSVDPGLVLFVQERAGLSVAQIREDLERRSGLLGLAGTSDLRQVLERRAAGEAQATLAYAVYVHRLRREIGAMAASAGGLDVVAFTGGAGEGSADLRADVVGGLGFLGCCVDPESNRDAKSRLGQEGAVVVSPSGSPVAVVVVEAREDLEMARQARAALGGEAARVSRPRR